MKLIHSTGVRAGADNHHRAASKRPFYKLGGLALLTGLSFAPMALPTPAIAQNPPPVAATHAPDTKIFPDLSFLRVKGPFGYRANPIKEMKNVPLAIRTAGDYEPIPSSTVSFPPDIDLGIFGLDVNLGPGISFNKNRFAVEVGAGAELFAFIFTDTKKQTVAPRPTPDREDYYVWYDVEPALKLGSISFRPYLSAEAKARIFGVGVVGLGYRLSKEKFVACNGHGGDGKYGDPNAQIKQYGQFKLVDMTIGMPYVLLGGYPLPDDNHHLSGSPPAKRDVGVYFYFGFKHILKENLSDLAKQGDLVYRKFAWAVGVSCNKVLF